MAERCASCGAELFTGQQFCRRCGTPTRGFNSGEIPTQILPAGGARPAGQTGEQPTDTTPLPSRDTDEAVYPSRYAGRAPHAPEGRSQFPHQTARHAGGRRDSRRGLFVALLAVLVVSVGASVFIARQIAIHWVDKKAREKAVKVVVPKVKAPESPPVPAVVVEHDEVEGPEDEGPLDEEGARVSDGETVITKTFPVDEGLSFAVANVAGDISVEGWDGEGAEVRITKRGGTPDEREAVQILHKRSAERLQLTTRTGDAAGVREVRYEIKLPRGLRQVDIASTDSNVSVSNIDAKVGIAVMRGEISVEGVAGTLSTRTTKGDTKVTFASADRAEPAIVNGINGNVEIKFPPGANADIKAETVDGRIEAGDDVKLSVQRRLSGEHAAGRLGRGGQPVVVKTVSGDIKIE